MDAFHVVGAGGIGCAVGHVLARAGARVRPLEATLTQTAPGAYAGNVVVGLAPGPSAR